MSNLFSKLAGSKVWGAIGLGLAALGAVCTTMPDKVMILAPDWGAAVCAAVVVIGAILAYLSKGAADRRKPVGPVATRIDEATGIYGPTKIDRRKAVTK